MVTDDSPPHAWPVSLSQGLSGGPAYTPGGLDAEIAVTQRPRPKPKPVVKRKPQGPASDEPVAKRLRSQAGEGTVGVSG
ncbi:hypothetical protein PsYK624_172860 [Phanerochaete sordida]|uniref:Uncharacterized protein n=1 Tax=Phanerochaete sordida TaxID=48140 RepID=A0A9P3GTZ2_9APHY|nr:hypothetical protein PsYK624_172860 [Phanerochaete sordida]